VTPPERLRVWVATGLGAGWVPRAPGTAGSLVGLGLGALLARAGGTPALLGGLAVVVAAGLWAAADAERLFGAHDPAPVVVDEVAGQMLALVLVAPSAVSLAASFLLFRLFDIAKPWPARRLEGLGGASGIMADDLLAGAYASLAQQIGGRALTAWGLG
jgi:phosphatidylglycerophosphatase A